MVLTDRDVISAAETDEEILTFDVSDDALERAAPYRRTSQPCNVGVWY
jgi:hypothetical protein